MNKKLKYKAYINFDPHIAQMAALFTAGLCIASGNMVF